jgi:hypothetical protein
LSMATALGLLPARSLFLPRRCCSDAVPPSLPVNDLDPRASIAQSVLSRTDSPPRCPVDPSSPVHVSFTRPCGTFCRSSTSRIGCRQHHELLASSVPPQLSAASTSKILSTLSTLNASSTVNTARALPLRWPIVPFHYHHLSVLVTTYYPQPSRQSLPAQQESSKSTDLGSHCHEVSLVARSCQRSDHQ